MLLAIAPLVVGVVKLTRPGWSSIAMAHLTQDGAWVLVSLPNPVFDAQVLAATTAGRQSPHESWQ